MSSKIPIIIHNRKEHKKEQIIIQVSACDTIQTLIETLSKTRNIARENLSVILCGHVLEKNIPIKELLLGPSTSLVVLVVDEKSLFGAQVSSSDSLVERPQYSSFFLWCKKCNEIKRGKLRVYCQACCGTAIVVKTEPSGWEDVLISNRIGINCEDCKRGNLYAVFRFKCENCNEIAAPLSQVRGNWEAANCIICTEEGDKYMFDLGCNHPVCNKCFHQYVENALDSGHFIMRAPYGYTLVCAYPGCSSVIRDAHHFRILGEQYNRYQEIATEKLVALHDQGVFCPFPDCNSYFFWENDNEDGTTYCPSCFRQFCRICKSRECNCNNDEDLTKVTIAATTKKCPGCFVSTEHNGGCLHMKCTSCSLNWCFRCCKPWSDECQWDHWFG